jgi:flagellar protein FliS
VKQKLQAYRQADTMGKSPLELLLMVYDGAIKSLRTAAEHYDRERNQAGYDELQRTKRMVTHLYTTLDNEKGGQIAANLGKVYSWALAQMQMIEATRDQQQIDAVITALNNLRAGWAELSARQRSGDKPNTPTDTPADPPAVPRVLTTA